LLLIFDLDCLALRELREGATPSGIVVVVQEILLVLAAMSRLRTSANAALAAFSDPRIFPNTHRGWKVSMNALERRLCRVTCAGVVHTTKIGSPANENSHIG
jgi:hypothetical protein